uniref:SAP domain-containing protein n=1 Tax=Plectus sambesii TaxID=2011161 RepID=A0A914WNN9_9BILA
MSTGDITSVKTRLSMLPYTELRKQAKENDIKANLKKDQLVEYLARKLVGDINPVSLKKEKRKGPRRYTVAVSSVASTDSSADNTQSSVIQENEESYLQGPNKNELEMEVEENVFVERDEEEETPLEAAVPVNVVGAEASQESLKKSRRSRRSAELNETFDGNSDGEEKLKEIPTSSGRDSNAARREKILAEINERAAARLAMEEKTEGASPLYLRNAQVDQQTASGGRKKTPGDGSRFRNVHEKLFGGMESIGDHLNKKQQRHLALTTGASAHLRALATPKTKARERQEMARKLPTSFTKNSPVRKQLPKKPTTAPGFKFDSPHTPGRLNFNFGATTPSRIQSVQQKDRDIAQSRVAETVRKSLPVATSSPAVRVRTRQQPLRPTKQSNIEPPASKVKKPANAAGIPKPPVSEKKVLNEPRAVRGGQSNQRYTPYKGRIPKFVDTAKMSDVQIDQMKRTGGLKNVHVTQATSRIATATTAVKRSVQLKQAQGRQRLVDSKRQIRA